MNVPVGVVTIAATPIVLRESRDPNASRDLDLAGSALLALGLAALVFGLTAIESDGAASPAALGGCAAAAALPVLFALRQRSARAPLLIWTDLRRPGFASAGLVAVLLTATTTPAIFLAVLARAARAGLRAPGGRAGHGPVKPGRDRGFRRGPGGGRAAGIHGRDGGRPRGGGPGCRPARRRRRDRALPASAGRLRTDRRDPGRGVGGFDRRRHGRDGRGREGLAAGLLGMGAQIGTVLGWPCSSRWPSPAPTPWASITAIAAGAFLVAVARRGSRRHPA